VIIFRAKRANGVWPKCMRDIRTGHLCTRTEASVPAEHIDCVAPDALPLTMSRASYAAPYPTILDLPTAMDDGKLLQRARCAQAG